MDHIERQKNPAYLPLLYICIANRLNVANVLPPENFLPFVWRHVEVSYYLFYVPFLLQLAMWWIKLLIN